MNTVNSAISVVFNLLFSPFRNANPFWGMLLVSFITGIIMLLVFKATSDQDAIKRAKNLVKGHFLAIRLYRDDIGLMFDTMKNIIVSNLLYIKQSLRPMLFLVVPVGLVLVQLGSRYEHRPLRPGEKTIVTVQLAPATDAATLRRVQLELPDGLALDAPPVRVEQLRQVSWRIRADKPGRYNLLFELDDKTVGKTLLVTESLVPISPKIAKGDLTTTLMNPAEHSLSPSAFATVVEILYPKREFEAFGFGVHWLIAFFVISVVAAFAFKGMLGVEV